MSGAGALASRKSLLCGLGSHRPLPDVRWNSGYYFTKCARCRCDLVRTAFGRWREPRGYRVVWQAKPPEGSVSAALVRRPPPSAPVAGAELPIQEVIRLVQNGDRAGEAPQADVTADTPVETGETPVGDGEIAPAAGFNLAEPDPLLSRALPARAIPDFMDDGNAGDAWEDGHRRYLRRTTTPAQSDGPKGEARQDGGWNPFTGVATGLAVLLERSRKGRREANEEPSRPRGRGRVAVWRLAGAVGLASVLVLAALFIGIAIGKRVSPDPSLAQGAPIRPDRGQIAFVTARVLNCRSAPALQAEPVEVLSRGDSVRLLARDGDWVSLVGSSGQCWALIRYFSVERPITGRT